MATPLLQVEQVIVNGSRKSLILPDSDIAGAMALKHGLKFARDMLFFKSNDKLDYLSANKPLRDQHHDQSYLGPILDDCKLLFSSFDGYNLVHVRRVTNQTVYYRIYAIDLMSDIV